jgi:hypothetical protein
MSRSPQHSMPSKKPTTKARKPAAKKPAVRGGTPRPASKAPAKRITPKRAPAKKPAPKRTAGRPTAYTVALADRICAELAESDVSLREICNKPGMPNRSTVNRWLEAHEDFATKYVRAREAQGEVLFDGMRAIEQKVLTRKLAPNAARVVLNNQQWRASKLTPKRYGVGVGGTGAGDENVGLLLVRDMTGRKD